MAQAERGGRKGKGGVRREPVIRKSRNGAEEQQENEDARGPFGCKFCLEVILVRPCVTISL